MSFRLSTSTCCTAGRHVSSYVKPMGRARRYVSSQPFEACLGAPCVQGFQWPHLGYVGYVSDCRTIPRSGPEQRKKQKRGAWKPNADTSCRGWLNSSNGHPSPAPDRSPRTAQPSTAMCKNLRKLEADLALHVLGHLPRSTTIGKCTPKSGARATLCQNKKSPAPAPQSKTFG